jgi:hypothetical protein
MYLKLGTVGKRERGNGEQMGGGGGHFTANQGSEWTGSHHDAKEGFQVSRREYRNRDGDFQEKEAKGVIKRIGLYTPIMLILYISCNHVNVTLIKNCV